MSGTDQAYDAPRLLDAYGLEVESVKLAEIEGQLRYAPTRACYAMPGTDLAYPPTRVLREVRY
eukprot:995709-Rhodomonas_salina.2